MTTGTVSGGTINADRGGSLLSVGMIPLEKFTLSPFASFLDVLRLAADKGDRSEQRNCNWSVMAPGQSQVTSSCGVTIATDRQPASPDRFDYIAIFGGLLQPNFSLDESTLLYLRKAEELNVPLISVCNGTFALIEAGLMKGRRSCISWYHHRDYVEAFGEIDLETEQIFVEDSDRITCSGGAGAADLGLWLVKRHIGDRWARKCQRILMLEEARPPTRSQPLPALSAKVNDPAVRQVVLAIERTLSEPITTADLANSVNMSRRHLERRFRQEMKIGVQEFVRDMRLRMAHDLLMNTGQTVTEIAYECGFKHHTYFTALFKKKFGFSPKEFREQNTELD